MKKVNSSAMLSCQYWPRGVGSLQSPYLSFDALSDAADNTYTISERENDLKRQGHC